MELKHDLALFVISKDLGQRRGNLETQYSSQETQTHKGERKVFTCAADRTRWPSGAVGTPAASSTSAAAPLPPGETAEPRFAAAVSLPFLAAALYLATAIAVVQDENTILLGGMCLTWGPVEVMFGPREDPSRILTGPHTASNVQGVAQPPWPPPSSPPPRSHAAQSETGLP